MPSNKNRLYVALYPSGVEDNEERKYHWGFIVGPKHEVGQEVPGHRYHVKNDFTGNWVFESMPLTNVKQSRNLIARILIAKIESKARLIQIIRSIPIIHGDPNWRCRTWVANVLAALEADGQAVGTSRLS